MSGAPDLELDCRGVVAELEALEGAVGDASSAARLDALRVHARGCAPCAVRHGARLARLEGLCALRSRTPPRRALQGLSTQVLERVRSGAAVGGMSATFLDAPRSLARWRLAAVAASVVLALGTGLLASGRLAWAPDGAPPGQERPLRDARDTLLLRWDAPRRERLQEDESFTPVLFPSHGLREFWDASRKPAPRPLANDPQSSDPLSSDKGD